MKGKCGLAMSKFMEHVFLKSFKEDSDVTYETQRNVLDSKLNLLFAWRSKESAISVLNLNQHSDIRFEQAAAQTLMLSKLPIFEVNRLLLNNAGNRCALIGPKGVAVVEIPALKWPSKAQSEDLKSNAIICSSRIVQQVHWNPSTVDEYIVAVLTTDNTIRLYSSNPARLISVFSLSNPQQTTDSFFKGRPFLASLGDTAIDFQFAPPMRKGPNTGVECGLEWPIIILRGNGDVCILQNISLDTKRSDKTVPSMIGPLPVYPSSDDNYGIDDASSLLVTSTNPPIVIIATSVGMLYHTVILDKGSSADKSESEFMDESYTSHTSLLVLECLEPQFGISVKLPENIGLYSCPVILEKDPTVNNRYYCIHETGMHIVNAPIISEFQEFAKCDENENDICMPKSKSSMEYAICTRLQVENSIFKISAPFLGFTVIESLNAVIAVLSNGEVVLYPLPPLPVPAIVNTVDIFESAVMAKSSSISINDENRRDNLETYVRTLLQPDPGYSKPIFQLTLEKDATSKIYSEFISHEMTVLKEGYLKKYAQALKEIERQNKVLSLMKEKQMQEAAELNAERVLLRKKAEKLADRYEELNEKNEALQIRYDKMLFAIGDLKLVDDDKNKMVETIRNLNGKVKILESKIDKIREKQNSQERQIDQIAINSSSPKISNSILSDLEKGMLQSDMQTLATEIDNLQSKLSNILQENFETSLASFDD